MAKKKEFKNYASNPLLAKKAYLFVKDLHTTLKKRRRALEDVWLECNEAFRCVERKSYFNTQMPYCSSDMRDAVLTIVPKLLRAVWYTDTPFDLIPIGEEGDDKDISDINQKVLEWDMRRLRIYQKYADLMFGKGIFGTCIAKTPPHFEKMTKFLRETTEQPYAGQKSKPGRKSSEWKKDRQRTFMGTDLIPIDLFDFWIDPSIKGSGVMDKIEYGDCIESIIVKQTDLKRGQESEIYVNVEKIEDYYIGAKGSKDSKKNRMKAVGKVLETQKSSNSQATIESGNKQYELLECYADFDLGRGVERCLIVVGADQECIRLQPWEDEKPYLSSRYYPNGYNGEFYGTGIIETNLSNHYERNATRKQIILARTMGLNMEMLSDQNGFPNRPDRLRTAPNKVHYVKNINSVKPFEKPIGQILQSGLAYETNAKSESQMSTGNTPYVQGADASKINDTATGIMQLTAAGNEKFSLPLQLDESSLLEPFIKRSLQHNIDYRKDAFVIRLTDKKPVKVYPEQLSANFDVYAKGSTELQNKELRQRGLINALDISLKMAPLEQQMYGAPLTEFSKLKQELFANLGLSNPEDYLIDPQELQNQQQVLEPEHEWILVKRMADGSVPPTPLMIQPGENYRDHYQDHMSRMQTEEFEMLPEQIKQVWYAHINSYQQVLNYIDSKKEAKKDVEIKSKEVAVSV